MLEFSWPVHGNVAMDLLSGFSGMHRKPLPGSFRTRNRPPPRHIHAAQGPCRSRNWRRILRSWCTTISAALRAPRKRTRLWHRAAKARVSFSSWSRVEYS